MKIVKVIPYLLIITVVSCNSQSAENNIVLCNIDTLNRSGISDLIRIVNSMEPKVIAIDLQFSEDTEYEQDTRLIQTLDNCENLVMGSVIESYTGIDEEYKRFTYGSLPDYTTNAKTGFINSLPGNDELITLRSFSILEKVNVNYEYHFAVRTAMSFDSLKAMKFANDNPKIVDVDYRGGKRNFRKFLSVDVLSGKVSRKDIEGKIVMIGFLGPGNEDKFFTPLNTNPNEPDMYGLEYLANIVAQVLEY